MSEQVGSKVMWWPLSCVKVKNKKNFGQLKTKPNIESHLEVNSHDRLRRLYDPEKCSYDHRTGYTEAPEQGVFQVGPVSASAERCVPAAPYA